MGHGDHVAVELRIKHPHRREAVHEAVGNRHGDRQRGRTVQEYKAPAGQLAVGIHLGQSGDSVADDLVILGRIAEGELQDVVGAGDVVGRHGVLLGG